MVHVLIRLFPPLERYAANIIPSIFFLPENSAKEKHASLQFLTFYSSAVTSRSRSWLWALREAKKLLEDLYRKWQRRKRESIVLLAAHVGYICHRLYKQLELLYSAACTDIASERFAPKMRFLAAFSVWKKHKNLFICEIWSDICLKIMLPVSLHNESENSVKLNWTDSWFVIGLRDVCRHIAADAMKTAQFNGTLYLLCSYFLSHQYISSIRSVSLVFQNTQKDSLQFSCLSLVQKQIRETVSYSFNSIRQLGVLADFHCLYQCQQVFTSSQTLLKSAWCNVFPGELDTVTCRRSCK